MGGRLRSAIVALIALSSATADAKYPLPPFQTDAQKAVLEYWRPRAAKLSEDALPEALALLDSAELRNVLRDCCPDVADLAARPLLDRIMQEVRSTEYAHGFGVWDHPDHDPVGWFNLELGEEYDFLLNSYQAQVAMRTSAASSGSISGPRKSPDPTLLAEESIFKLPHVQNASNISWAEASDRLVYVAQNWRQLSFGSNPIYGEAALVLANDHIKDTILASPVDTGAWEVVCNHTLKNIWDMWLNCDPWRSDELGTWDHFNHILLKNLQVWRYSHNKNGTGRIPLQRVISSFFGRGPLAQGYPNVPNLTLQDSMAYWETNVVANVRFPEGVRFLIADFGALFGSDSGRRIQKFAKKYGWGLVWANTDFVQKMMKLPHPYLSKKTVALTGRFLDPSPNLTEHLNATITDTSLNSFQQLWQTANRTRTAQGGNATSGQVIDWWHQLLQTQVALAPATATRCGGLTSSCLGYRLSPQNFSDSDCICYRTRPSSPVATQIMV